MNLRARKWLANSEDDLLIAVLGRRPFDITPSGIRRDRTRSELVEVHRLSLRSELLQHAHVFGSGNPLMAPPSCSHVASSAARKLLSTVGSGGARPSVTLQMDSSPGW